jgi:uroporphyrinogen decarboxylase
MEPNPFAPLPRIEVIKAIERGHPVRIPLVMTHWWGDGFAEMHGPALRQFDRYPEDARLCLINLFDYPRMGLSWQVDLSGAHDQRMVMDDWAKLDELIAHFPDPRKDPQFEQAAQEREQARREDRYFLFGWWRLFFECPWEIRGMTNLLMDYYIHPQEVHRLNQALCDLYCAYLDYAISTLQPDGFWTSDDLGHQTQLFMRPQTFREFLKPYYARVGQKLQPQHVHWWLHSCGNNTAVLADLAEVGLNVFHPVQKHTMDEAAVARDFGDKLTFLVGFDVQQTLAHGTPAQVRAEVRHLIRTFNRPEGGLCLAAGNGILPGTPLENVQAFLDECMKN